MQADNIFLKPSEVAMVAEVPIRAVNHAIETHMIPADMTTKNEHGRMIDPGGCLIVMVACGSGKNLSADGRLEVTKKIAEKKWLFAPHLLPTMPEFTEKSIEWTISVDRFLTVDLNSEFDRCRSRILLLWNAKKSVDESNSIMGGTPVIKGTRVPVYQVAGLVKSGVPMSEVLDDYPGLTEEQVELAVAYAAATPQKGRPISNAKTSPPKGAKVIHDYKIFVKR